MSSFRTDGRMGRFLDEIFFLSPPYRSTEERLTKGNNLPAFLVLFFFIFIIRNKRLSPPCRKVWLPGVKTTGENVLYPHDLLTIERSQIIKHTGENEVGQLQKEKMFFFFKTLFSPRLFKGSLKNIWLKSRGGSHKLRFHHSNLIVFFL